MGKCCSFVMALCLAIVCAACNDVKNVSQSPEDYVRERYGIPYQTEVEYEAMCRQNRQIEGFTVFDELQAWIAAYYVEDAFFSQKLKEYEMLYDTIEELAIGVMFNRGNDEEAFKALLVEAGYGNEAQCKALIEGLKKDGFLVQELVRMRQAHRERLMAEIVPLCEDLGEVDIAYQIKNTNSWREGEVEPDCVKRVYLKVEPAWGETMPGECPYWFRVHVEMDEARGTIGSVSIGNTVVTMGHDEAGKRSGRIELKNVPMLNSGELLTVNFWRNYK